MDPREPNKLAIRIFSLANHSANLRTVNPNKKSVKLNNFSPKEKVWSHGAIPSDNKVVLLAANKVNSINKKQKQFRATLLLTLLVSNGLSHRLHQNKLLTQIIFFTSLA